MREEERKKERKEEKRLRKEKNGRLWGEVE